MKNTLLKRQRRGLAVVEMVLMLPILLFLVLGGIDMALQIHVLHNMTNAAREAARTLAVRQGTLTQAREDALNQLGDPTGKLYTITAHEPVGGGDYDVTVHISVPRTQVSLGGFDGFFGAGNLNSEVTMRKEGI
jgi:hypothetical protein